MGARGSRVSPNSILVQVESNIRPITDSYNITSESDTDIHVNYDTQIRMKICRRNRETYIKLTYNGYIEIDKPNTFKEGSVLNISMNRTIRRTNWDIEYLRWPEGLTSIKLKYTHRQL